ncbi:ABC transporter ATP-binding protein [Streptomyces albus]|uniref:ABC-type quaternary amine transporter n=1 Tax=Streptomyces albus TaxID=1888 RepID=A0A6C1C6F2_9ACTN|nr:MULTISPECIES: ABC transporter ATP-binding protein [Streptomyces]KPC73609.1 phosphonate ABC transporter ATP-binding protein [Streptomyces sp. NRRL F-6602]EPD95059.1 2-aminoethylphosphonate ABC transport system, ATP-binding component PhnT [Streptomyces sp. HPH0547]QID36506.1 ABC transporter ATP-binding protein [Streptomyces albus]TGG77345.1 ABC transporter ATP-binding protein [Streptomyces albus]UVN56648.1 ABC transporter ATP-binding protein [Streptomyces albus]
MSEARRSGIRFEEVTVAYDGTVVLDGFDLTVEPGEVMALLGPSGSGKTTALRAVAGFVRPAAGRVLIGDRDVTGLPPHARDVGMVVQSYALFPHMRVADNVAFGLKARRTPRGEIAARVAEALEMVGMADYARRHPRELSGGQQQRVAIARALAVRPGVLLLDEPLSALDARLRSGMLAELDRLHRELPDVSVLYVTHDQVEALTLADRVAVMDRARLREVGTPEQLYRAPRRTFTADFVGAANLLPVVGAPGGTVRFGDARLKVASPAPSAGAEATLCVRPHRITLGEEAANVLRGTVTAVQWRGATHRVAVEVAGREVVAELPETAEPPAVGAEVPLSFAVRDGVLVDD